MEEFDRLIQKVRSHHRTKISHLEKENKKNQSLLNRILSDITLYKVNHENNAEGLIDHIFTLLTENGFISNKKRPHDTHENRHTPTKFKKENENQHILSIKKENISSSDTRSDHPHQFDASEVGYLKSPAPIIIDSFDDSHTQDDEVYDDEGFKIIQINELDDCNSSMDDLITDNQADDTTKQDSRFAYQFDESFRKAKDREEMMGIECPDCKAYYDAIQGDGSHEFDRTKFVDKCSRHRVLFPEPTTPPHMFDIDDGF
eukprot:TRINITY_DN8414_c0_g1_i1.p1 TRINITY_DN8414_c0_g1~~TRINITY_DN8414_c0_g1_i1.p1  ORF type:complete len:267 (+),score=60.92 TRINITY_DN8414_c0_g1_i1:25-801(+)